MFFAHDAGGANAIFPLIPSFGSSLVFGLGPALNIIPDAVILPDNALIEYKPDFLITGTSENDFTERNLWKESRTLNIKSMAILDAWTNYGLRFSKFSGRNKHLFDGKCDCLPDYICVMDEIAKKDMIHEGIPNNIIFPFGNPYFEYIAARAEKLGNQDTIVFSESKQTIMFASQPFYDVFMKGSEIQALEDLIEITRGRKDVKIIIRKHPAELSEKDKYSGYLNEDVIEDHNCDVLSTIIQSDIVVSINSNVLIEALFLKKPILSYQPKMTDANDFILTRNKTIPFINNRSDLKRHLIDLLDKKTQMANNPIPYKNTVKLIRDFISEVMYGKAGN
jgi:hypothetical protein